MAHSVLVSANCMTCDLTLLDLYVISTSWSIAANCGLTKTDYASSFTLSGSAAVVYQDTLLLGNDSFVIYRTSSASLRFSMTFPTNISVSMSNSVIGAQGVIDSAVIQQTYNPDSGSLTIGLFTRVSSGYTLSNIRPTNITAPGLTWTISS